MTPTELARHARPVLSARLWLRGVDDVGARVRCWGRPVVRNAGSMTLGDRVRVISDVARTELVTGAGGTLRIGERTYINYGSSISASRLVTIGARCLLGTYTLVIDDNFHHVDPARRMEATEPAPVRIADDVWLGAKAVVLPGVSIGTGSVIGAGSVVTRDIPPQTLAVGLPARVVRQL